MVKVHHWIDLAVCVAAAQFLKLIGCEQYVGCLTRIHDIYLQFYTLNTE